MQFRITEDNNAILDQDHLQRDLNYDRIVDKAVPGLKFASLLVTGTQILALNVTPIDIVAAVANKKIVPIFISFDYTFNTAAFLTNVDIIATMSGTAVATSLSGLAGAVSKFTIPTWANPVTLATNTALRLSVATGNPTAGNAAAALLATVHYRLM